MTQISFTSGEIVDVIDALRKEADNTSDPNLSAYYYNLIQQFERVYKKLFSFPGENRVANLILAAN